MIQVILNNSLTNSEVAYSITPNDTKLAKDWEVALKEILEKKLRLEKEFCFLGFPNSNRSIRIICWELNRHIERINKSDLEYRIPDYFVKDSVMYDVEKYNFRHDPDHIKHDILNRLHNHFEVLQGTVEKISDYYLKADNKIKENIKH